MEVERHERPAERRRRARERGRTSRRTPTRAPLELVVAVDPREPQQHVREHRVARRRRVVVEVLLPRDEPLAVARARGRSRRARRRRRARPRAARAGAPPRASAARPSRRAARAGRARRSRSRRGSPVPLVRPSRQVRCSRPSASESGPSRNSPRPARRVDQSGRSSRRPASASAASASPFQEAIALSSRAASAAARALEQPRPHLLVELAAEDRAAVLERLEQLGRRALLLGPGERQALDALGVGVLRRGEAALRQQQLAQHVLERRSATSR